MNSPTPPNTPEPGQTDCRHLLDELSDYLDGQAGPEICGYIEKHLAGCSDCQVVVDTLSKTVHLYRSLPGEPMPTDARRRLFKSLNLSEFLKT